ARTPDRTTAPAGREAERRAVPPAVPPAVPRPGLGRRLRDGPGELVAATEHGADQPLLLAGVPARHAGGPERRGDRRLAHETVAPHRVEKLFLGHDPVAVHDQIMDDVERPRLDRNAFPRAPEFVEGGIELESVETVRDPMHACRLPPRPTVTVSSDGRCEPGPRRPRPNGSV